MTLQERAAAALEANRSDEKQAKEEERARRRERYLDRFNLALRRCLQIDEENLSFQKPTEEMVEIDGLRFSLYSFDEGHHSYYYLQVESGQCPSCQSLIFETVETLPELGKFLEAKRAGKVPGLEQHGRVCPVLSENLPDHHIHKSQSALERLGEALVNFLADEGFIQTGTGS